MVRVRQGVGGASPLFHPFQMVWRTGYMGGIAISQGWWARLKSGLFTSFFHMINSLHMAMVALYDSWETWCLLQPYAGNVVSDGRLSSRCHEYMFTPFCASWLTCSFQLIGPCSSQVTRPKYPCSQNVSITIVSACVIDFFFDLVPSFRRQHMIPIRPLTRLSTSFSHLLYLVYR